MNNLNIKFLNLFYDYPLYDYAQEDEINVLIVSQHQNFHMFLSKVLEFGQIYNKKLFVHVLSTSTEDKQNYLNDAPELYNFFKIDNSYSNQEYEPYGELIFSYVSNYNEIENHLLNFKRKYTYIFVDCGDSSIKYGQIIKWLYDCSIVFSIENNDLYIIKDEKTSIKYECEEYKSDLLQMAFNTHLVWKNDLSDISVEYERFLTDEYSLLSSYSNAVSNKYKLYSVGIPLNDLIEAANLTKELFDKNPKTIEILAFIEHKRWVVEKITNKWKSPHGENDKFSYILKNIDIDNLRDQLHIDPINKIHACIAHSKPSLGLSEMDRWDKGSLENLDELDKTSVLIYRKYLENKSKLLQWFSPQNKEGYGKVLKLFNDTENLKYLNELRLLCDGILNCNKYLGVNTLDKLNKLAKGLELESLGFYEENKTLFKTLFANLLLMVKTFTKVDFKKIDFDIVQNIPFILSYNRNIHLGLPFSYVEKGIKVYDTSISNVASATCIKPSKITYFIYLNKTTTKGYLKSLNYVCEHIKAKVCPVINFIVVFDKGANGFLSQIAALSTELNSSCEFIDLEDPDYLGKLENVLKKSGITHFDLTEQLISNPHLEHNLKSLIYNEFNTFVFDKSNKEVIYCLDSFSSKNKDCKILKYIENINFYKNAFLDFEETIKLKNERIKVKNEKFNTLKETEILWDKFISDDRGRWNFYNNRLFKVLCSIISFDDTYPKYDSILFKNGDFYYIYEGVLDNKKCEPFFYKKAAKDKEIFKEIIRTSHGLGLLEILFEDENSIEFKPTEKGSKTIFGKEGNLFEYFCFYSVIKTGYFDDCKSGVSISSSLDNLDFDINEFDLVLIKGFNIYIVECKNTKVSIDMAYKLQCATNVFGNNVQSFLAYTGQIRADYKERINYYGVNLIEATGNSRQFGNTLLKKILGR